MQIKIRILLSFCLFLSTLEGYTQVHRNVIQFSGIVVNNEDLTPIPYTNVSINGTGRGTSADANGFFSFAALAGETITFSSVGFISTEYRIPETISANYYSIIQSMTHDTLLLSETVIYPWPSKDKFREAFLNLELPKQDAEIIHKNFNYAALRERALDGKMTSSMNYRQQMQQQVDKLYYYGQVTPNNLLNPFAWASFIKEWKRQKEANRKYKDSDEYQDY